MRAALSQARRADFDAALAEYEKSLEYNADTAEGRYGLGLLRERLGDADGAEAAYRSALELQPDFAPAYVNLADLLRRNGREAEGIALLERAVASELRGASSIRAALGFAYVRSGNGEAALAEFDAAVKASPDDPYLAYTNGLAIDSLVGRDEAIATLEAATQRFPGYAPMLFALATMHRDGGNVARALTLTDALLEVSPGDASGLSLRAELRSPP
jgi:tetratricopeptide (TPR) repeat protein